MFILISTIESLSTKTNAIHIILWFTGMLGVVGLGAFLYYELVYKPSRDEKNRKANEPKYKTSYLPNVPPIKTICGDIFPLTSRDDFSGGNVVYLSANQPAKPHYHRETTEFYIVVDGRGSLWLDGEEMPIWPGVVVIVHSGTIHNVVPVNGETLKVWVVAVPAWRAEDEIEVDETNAAARR